ncbi:hypothetical protein HN51_014973 [Arachis hypogaea]|uniref:MATH domain and coiled-coil domain-containing protein At3g58360 n=1 Tax=Arachis hypogaea TaxID=3818 RepID=UPI000DEC2D57|nr:MATH domain and coiled-coil domain-containing protein At3g58210 [Arachis hypogaea]
MSSSLMDMPPDNPVLSIRHMRGRKSPPSQYSFEVKSFSLLAKASIEKVTSEEFEAGDCKWSLSIYPTGNKRRAGEGHVSIYLALTDPSSLPLDWEVNAIVNFSLYNFHEDEYVTTQDASTRRFHVLKTEWGIAKFIDLHTFYDSSNGYLIEDTCVFGAEVFVVKTTNKGDCLSMIKEPATLSHSWKFNNYSLANLDKYESPPFLAGDYKWKIRVYPNGTLEGKGNSISMFLALDTSTLPPNAKLLMDYTVRAKDQIGGHHAEAKACCKFSHSSAAWGSRQLVALAKFKDPSSGFLVGDSCILEAEFRVLGLINPLTGIII